MDNIISGIIRQDLRVMNPTQTLKNFLNQIHPLKDEDMNLLLEKWEEKKFDKNDIVTSGGQIENYLYFILDGVQKAYYVKGGKSYVIAFTFPPSFTCIPESFITQKPSYYYLECLSKSWMLRISRFDLEELAETSHDIESLFRKSMENVLAGLVIRYHQMLAYSMKERFQAFIKRSPELLQKVPHKDIASYLGMDPTNFSKLYNSIKI